MNPHFKFRPQSHFKASGCTRLSRFTKNWYLSATQLLQLQDPGLTFPNSQRLGLHLSALPIPGAHSLHWVIMRTSQTCGHSQFTSCCPMCLHSIGIEHTVFEPTTSAASGKWKILEKQVLGRHPDLLTHKSWGRQVLKFEGYKWNYNPWSLDSKSIWLFLMHMAGNQFK